MNVISDCLCGRSHPTLAPDLTDFLTVNPSPSFQLPWENTFVLMWVYSRPWQWLTFASKFHDPKSPVYSLWVDAHYCIGLGANPFSYCHVAHQFCPGVREPK